jgi:hypothetical protein
MVIQLAHSDPTDPLHTTLERPPLHSPFFQEVDAAKDPSAAPTSTSSSHLGLSAAMPPPSMSMHGMHPGLPMPGPNLGPSMYPYPSPYMGFPPMMHPFPGYHPSHFPPPPTAHYPALPHPTPPTPALHAVLAQVGLTEAQKQALISAGLTLPSTS